jgi:hypothetical protein
MLENPGNWLPARAALRPEGLYLALRDVGPGELKDAFMQETILRMPASEAIVHIAREDVGKAAPGTAPVGLIFHVARCGSTLISQLLKKHEPLVVYAEPLPVNEILLPPHKWPRGELVCALRSLGDALARHSRGPYVLKFSSWNTLFCDILADAFPDSPWILSLRDPVEVGVSMLSQPPGWLWEPNGPASQFASFAEVDPASRSPEDHVARLYGAMCQAVARLDPRRGKLVHYEALPAAVWEIVGPHFSLSIGEQQRQRMAEAARNHSKAPPGQVVEFARDDAMKQAAASTRLRQAVESFARPPLEHLRGIHLDRLAAEATHP